MFVNGRMVDVFRACLGESLILLYQVQWPVGQTRQNRNWLGHCSNVHVYTLNTAIMFGSATPRISIAKDVRSHPFHFIFFKFKLIRHFVKDIALIHDIKEGLHIQVHTTVPCFFFAQNWNKNAPRNKGSHSWKRPWVPSLVHPRKRQNDAVWETEEKRRGMCAVIRSLNILNPTLDFTIFFLCTLLVTNPRQH